VHILYLISRDMDSGKSYHKECTGLALETANKHQDINADITLFGGCFCPFVQRVWATFEYLGVPYKVSSTCVNGWGG
jgi:glutathione S-transferase